MFEHRSKPLLPRRAFIVRVLRFGTIALGIVLVSLLLGVIGYRTLEGMSWVDAIVNAAMILGGMGPVNEFHSDAGKLFAAAYALYSGIVFLIAVGIFVAPVVHRVYHRFHLEAGDDGRAENHEE